MMNSMAVKLLVDGYNLLYVMENGLLRTLQEKRESLLDKLHRYQVEKKVAMTVVFDSSFEDPQLSKNDRYGEIQIHFTDRSTSADEWIKNECSRHPGAYVVVSSDQEIIHFVKAQGSVSLTSQEFAQKLKSINEAIERSQNPYLEDKEDSDILYPKITTKKKGAAKKLPKRERRKLHQLKNL